MLGQAAAAYQPHLQIWTPLELFRFAEERRIRGTLESRCLDQVSNLDSGFFRDMTRMVFQRQTQRHLNDTDLPENLVEIDTDRKAMSVDIMGGWMHQEGGIMMQCQVANEIDQSTESAEFRRLRSSSTIFPLKV